MMVMAVAVEREKRSERVRCYRDGRTIDATKRTNATLEKREGGVYNEYL